MSVLVDTSIWIRFLADRHPYAAALDALLAKDEVLADPLVFGELLIGDRGGRKALLSAYRQIAQAQPVPHEEVVALVEARKLGGRGLGWIDASLLAAALTNGARLWTADAALDKIADELGLGYAVTR